MIPLIYHPNYHIQALGFENDHPFDIKKYKRIHDALIERGLRRDSDFLRPGMIRRRDLVAVHSLAYLKSLRRPEVLASIVELPAIGRLPVWLVHWILLRPMRFATAGTILACRKALESGVAINLGGGFHHAAAEWGHGFCVYADIPLAAKILHDEGLIRRVLVVDLDVHQGNGTAAVFHSWPWAAIFDIYERDNFPGVKEVEDYPLAVESGMSGWEYLRLVAAALPIALDQFGPDLVIYNAGSDPFMDDMLGGLCLSMSELAERDLMVISMARERGIPVAMVLSGGYSKVSWKIHVQSIEGILTRFDRD